MGIPLSVFAKKVLGVGLSVVVVGVLIGLYIGVWATSFPRKPKPRTRHRGWRQKRLTLETVAAVGEKLSPSHPTWVSYLAQSNGKWVHSTTFVVPAYTVVHVTLYQFDSPTGLRNRSSRRSRARSAAPRPWTAR